MTNAGTLDRTLRIILGTTLVSMVFVGPQTFWGLLGIIPLATGLMGFCPLYRLVGVNTCKLPARPASPAHPKLS